MSDIQNVSSQYEADDEDASTDSEPDNMEDSQKDEEGRTRLHIAAARGDTEAVRNLLMSSATGDVLYTKHSTPSHKVTKYRRVDLDDLSLIKGDGVNARTAFGETSLYLAAENGHLATVQLLLNSMADVNAICRSQWTPLHLAAFYGHADIAQNLIRYGANVNACNNDKMTALHLACQNGHTFVVGILLDNHATVDVVKQSEETPFYLAAENGHADVTDLLLSRGVCDFMLTDNNYGCRKLTQTPLHVAIQKGNTEVVEVIWKHRCRISGKLVKHGDKLHENATDVIETSGIQPIQLFRQDGRSVSAGLVWTEINKPLEIWENSYNETALDLAVVSRQAKMVNLFLNADQCPYSEEHLRNSFERLNTTINDYKVTDCMNNDEATIVQSDDKQHEIFYENIKEIAQALTNSIKFNVNHQDDAGQTLLHGIVKFMDIRIREPVNKIQMMYLIQLLLEKGADFNLRNSKGETPLMIASAIGYCDAIPTMFDWEEHSGMKLEVNLRDQYGETALIKAAERNHVSVMRLLLKHKASVNLYDYYGFTALHAVVYEPNTNWFDLYFFCKGLNTSSFHGVNSLKIFGLDSCEMKSEDPETFFDRLQRCFEYNERTIRLREEAVKLLLDNDETNVKVIDFTGSTPLDLALKSSKRICSAIVKALEDRGATEKFQEPEDEAPIELARVDKRGRNPLHRLIISGISDCLFDGKSKTYDSEIEIDFMINAILLNPENFGELATAADNKGRTPLHYAAMLSSYRNYYQLRDLMKVLLEIGSKVNAADIYGKIPLHYAEEKDKYKLLVLRGADENTMDNYGNTPRDIPLRDLIVDESITEYFPDGHLYLYTDIAQIFNTNHVTELSRRKLVANIRIYSQSPCPEESSEERVWKMWTKKKFIRLNRRLSQLKPSLKRFIQRLADGIKKRDWRFECQPILVGSAEEETKVVETADFDFNFKLNKLSQYLHPFPHPLGPTGYFELRRKTNKGTKSRSDKEFDSFFNLDHCLLTDEVNCRFKIILGEVLSDPDFWQDEHSFDWNMKYRKYRSGYGNLGGLCRNVRLGMIHPIEDGEGGFLFVNISIDIVACVHVEDWWPEDTLPAGINPSVKTDGCTFVFHRPNSDIYKPRDTHFIFSDTFARITFAPLESQIIKESSPLSNAAYMVCKMIFYRRSGTSYQLKTCLMFCMEALNARNATEARTSDEISPRQLAFWVERIIFCFMEFSRHGFYPCYLMPSFRRRAAQMHASQFQYLLKKNDESDEFSEELRDFSYYFAFGLYLDLCPVGYTFDIPMKAQAKHRLSDRMTHDQNGVPIWEQFDCEELIRKLSSRRYN